MLGSNGSCLQCWSSVVNVGCKLFAGFSYCLTVVSMVDIHNTFPEQGLAGA